MSKYDTDSSDTERPSRCASKRCKALVWLIGLILNAVAIYFALKIMGFI